jgi:hypothetical protein
MEKEEGDSFFFILRIELLELLDEVEGGRRSENTGIWR